VIDALHARADFDDATDKDFLSHYPNNKLDAFINDQVTLIIRFRIIRTTVPGGALRRNAVAENFRDLAY
jgi:hypothetical protein